MTVKTRITLFIVTAGFVASLLFSVVVFYEMVEQPFDLLDTVLKEEAYRTVNMVINEQKELEPHAEKVVSTGLDRYWIEISDKDTRKVLFQSNLAKTVELSHLEPGSGAIAKITIPEKQSKSKEVTVRVKTFLLTLEGKSYVVQIARPMGKLENEIWDLILGIFSGLVLSTLVLTAISRFVAGKILQPIGRIKELTQVISEKNLDQRIEVSEGQDEFNELSKTINRMLDRLQYSFVRQRDLLFDSSHELKTPLTTMRLAVDEICASHSEELPSFVRDNFLRLNTQVLRMERLVKDLLNLSTLETLTELEREPVEMTELLTSLAEEYRFLAEAHGITLEVTLPQQLSYNGDAEKLHRVFSNILDNAVKYNLEGGQIKLSGEQTDIELIITVSNTGFGVPKSEIPKVFDQFYRVEKSRSMIHGCSGLGLAIVKKTIDLYGGRVEFESQEGGWTQVTVHLPMSSV